MFEARLRKKPVLFHTLSEKKLFQKNFLQRYSYQIIVNRGATSGTSLNKIRLQVSFLHRGTLKLSVSQKRATLGGMWNPKPFS